MRARGVLQERHLRVVPCRVMMQVPTVSDHKGDSVPGTNYRECGEPGPAVLSRVVGLVWTALGIDTPMTSRVDDEAVMLAKFFSVEGR